MSLCLPGGQEGVLPAASGPHQGGGKRELCNTRNIKDLLGILQKHKPLLKVKDDHLGFFVHAWQVVSESGFKVTRRVLVDFEGINLRRKFLSGVETENIHMMIGLSLLHFSDSNSGVRFNFTGVLSV